MSRKLSIFLSILLLTTLIIPISSAQDDDFELTILHTNDTHSHHEPQADGNGGAARQAAVVNQIRAEGGNVVLLDGGDRFTGTLFHTQYKGQDQVQIMNLLGYNAMALGNHEFDNGDDVLAAFLDGINFPALTANADFSASPDLKDKVEPYTVLDVGGEKIGVIGLTTADAPTISSPGDEIIWRGDYVQLVNGLAAELTEQGVNKIFLLTHTGIDVDLAIIEQLEGIDVYIGGHSHTLYSNANTGAAGEYPLTYTSATGEPIYYVQAGEKDIYLGRLDVAFDASGIITNASGDTILLSRYITPDPEMDALITELAGPIEELRNTPVGATTDVLLEGDRLICRVEECNLGNVIADSMRAETGAQIAIMNGGGIRASIEPGDITLGEVLTVQPFTNLISEFEISGADVIAALENGVSLLVVENGIVQREGAAGRFPQVSGIRYTIDPTLAPGSRIVSVDVLGENGEYAPIDPEMIYTIATLNFIRTGGDGYTIFNDNAIEPYDFGRADYEVTADYLPTITPITAEVEGRITYVNAEIAPMP